MIPDAECVRVISEVLSDLKLGKFVVKVSVSRPDIPHLTMATPLGAQF